MTCWLFTELLSPKTRISFLIARKSWIARRNFLWCFRRIPSELIPLCKHLWILHVCWSTWKGNSGYRFNLKGLLFSLFLTLEGCTGISGLKIVKISGKISRKCHVYKGKISFSDHNLSFLLFLKTDIYRWLDCTRTRRISAGIGNLESRDPGFDNSNFLGKGFRIFGIL